MSRKFVLGASIKGLLIFLAIITVLVILMVDYHNSTESPFRNELFFGPMDPPAESKIVPANSPSRP